MAAYRDGRNVRETLEGDAGESKSQSVFVRNRLRSCIQYFCAEYNFIIVLLFLSPSLA